MRRVSEIRPWRLLHEALTRETEHTLCVALLLRRFRDAALDVRGPGSLKARGRARQGHQYLQSGEARPTADPPACSPTWPAPSSSPPGTAGTATSCGEAMAPAGERGWSIISARARALCATSKGACRGQGASSYPSGLTAVGQDPRLHLADSYGTTAVELLAKRWHGARDSGWSRTSIPGAGVRGPLRNPPTWPARSSSPPATSGPTVGLWRSHGSAAGTTLGEGDVLQAFTSRPLWGNNPRPRSGTRTAGCGGST